MEPDGTFEIEKALLSPVTVTQNGPLEGWTVKAVRWKGEDIGTAGLQFTPGEPVTGIEVVLGRVASRLTGSSVQVRRKFSLMVRSMRVSS